MSDHRAFLRVVCCDQEWEIAHDMRLLRRIEQMFGPVQPLADRLESGAIRQQEVVTLLSALLHDVPESFGPPSRGQIEAWVFEAGTSTAARPLAVEVMMLIVGNEVLTRVLERRRAADIAAGKPLPAGEGGDGPFVPVAPSTGHGGS